MEKDQAWPQPVDEGLARILADHEIDHAAAAAMTDDELLAVPGVGKGRLGRIRRALAQIKDSRVWIAPEGDALDEWVELAREFDGLSNRMQQLQQQYQAAREAQGKAEGGAEAVARILARLAGAPMDKPLIFDGQEFRINEAPDAPPGIAMSVDRSVIQPPAGDEQSEEQE